MSSGRRAAKQSQPVLPFVDPLELSEIFSELHQELTSQTAPDFEITFYPYAGLKHTIRSRNGRILLRLSDLVRRAPIEVFRATLALLICRRYSLQPPVEYEQTYLIFSSSREVQQASLEARASRGRKRLTHHRGQVHDLRAIFDKLNQEYFGGELEVRHLSWSPGKSKRVLGHYDRAHDAIVLSRILDRKRVPKFVVEYVLYHEMLHAALGERRQGNRRDIHHRRFRRAEQEFAQYSQARRFIHDALGS